MEPTFLTAIHIHKVRHLTDIGIPLSSDVRKNLILTGKNGSGKTSVLKVLAAHLAYVFKNHQTIGSYNEFPYSISTASLSGCTVCTAWEPAAISTSCKAYECNLEELHEQHINGGFILAFHGDKRNLQVNTSNAIEKVYLESHYEIYAEPSKELAKYMVNLKTTQAFAKNEGNQSRADEIETWFQRFEKILRTIYEDGSLRLNFDIENFQFTITMDGREPFDFNTMSMGYAAVFDIIGDLMMRMESQHRYDLEGIVLIDEIETHLHVELQKKIVPILTELFPNIQFILTTHSPFVLNSAQNAVIYDLEKRMLVKNGLTNLPYEGIVEGYFGADRLSQELREKFDRYRVLAGKAEPTDEEYAEIAELETYLDEVPDFLALDFAVEYSRLKLELASRG